MERISRWIVRNRLAWFLVWGLLLAAALPMAPRLAPLLKGGADPVSGTPSARAAEAMRERFGRGFGNVIPVGLDASLIRLALVPALMELFGAANSVGFFPRTQISVYQYDKKLLERLRLPGKTSRDGEDCEPDLSAYGFPEGYIQYCGGIPWLHSSPGPDYRLPQRRQHRVCCNL